MKDGINNYVVAGRNDAVNPNRTGTKVAADYAVEVGAGEVAAIWLRLSTTASAAAFGEEFDQLVDQRRLEANEFYRAISPAGTSEDATNVMRQALAGMLWSKQYFFYDTDKWLEEHGVDPMHPDHQAVRNRETSTFMVITAPVSVPVIRRDGPVSSPR